MPHPGQKNVRVDATSHHLQSVNMAAVTMGKLWTKGDKRKLAVGRASRAEQGLYVQP